MIAWTLTEPQYWVQHPWSTTKVRLSNDARRCVIFLGDCDTSGDPASFKAFATAFLVVYSGIPRTATYLITAKHVVSGDDPVWVRMNTKKAAITCLLEQPDWTFHPDPTVDLAVLAFDPPAEADCMPWGGTQVSIGSSLGPGPGSITYMVGLFRAHGGRSRNIPVVHSGNVAAGGFSEEDKVDVEDWDYPEDQHKRKLIEAFVVQCSALPGASGAPVFVREEMQAANTQHRHDNKRGEIIRDGLAAFDAMPQAYGKVRLLGVWRGSWELPQSEFVAGARVRYPAGYGTVVPAYKISEILNMPKLKVPRDAAQVEAKAARQQSVEIPVSDALPRKTARRLFDATLKTMLNTPPAPRKSS